MQLRYTRTDYNYGMLCNKGRDMAMSGSAQEANVLSFRLVQNKLEFYTALTSAFSLLTITMTSRLIEYTNLVWHHNMYIRSNKGDENLFMWHKQLNYIELRHHLNSVNSDAHKLKNKRDYDKYYISIVMH